MKRIIYDLLIGADTMTKLTNLSGYLFNMSISDFTSTILINMDKSLGLIEQMEKDYEYVKNYFIDLFEIDLLVLKKKFRELMMYIKEFNEPIDYKHGPMLHELINIIFEMQEDDFYNNEYMLDRLEYNAFYLSTAKEYSKAILHFEKYLEAMKDNNYLNIRKWLAHNEYIKCLWHCRKDSEHYNKLIPALKYNIELYKKVNYRLKKTNIIANKYLQFVEK